MDESSEPSVCDTNLIHGTTRNRLFKIPVGMKFKKAPSDINNTNINSIKDMCDK